MGIALFTDTFPDNVNGVARTLGSLVEHAVGRGHQVAAVSARVSRESAPGTVFHHQLPGLPLPMYPEVQLARPVGLVGKGLLAEFKPDLVHVATERTVGWSGRGWARRRDAPLVSSFHTDWPAWLSGYGFGGLESPLWAGLKRFHSAARITFSPSSATLDQLRAHGFEHDVRIRSRGVDTECYAPRWRGEEVRREMAPGADRILVYVGRLAPEKRLDVLLEAFSLVRKALGPRVALVLVGDGPWLGRLRGKAVEGVYFLGYRTGRALAEAYASGDLFVFPSDTETFGNVVVEALASGLPVIAAAKGGGVDSVIPGETGELVPPRNPTALAEAVIRVLSDEDYRRVLSRKARAFAEARTWDGVMDRLLGDYREALEAGNGRGGSSTGTRSAPPSHI